MSSASIQEMLDKKKHQMKVLSKREVAKSRELKNLAKLDSEIKHNKLPVEWRTANPITAIIQDFEDLDVNDDKFDAQLATLKDKHGAVIKSMKSFT